MSSAVATGAQAQDCVFRGEPAVELSSGGLAAVFAPNVGMTGVSLRYRGGEHLALPGGLEALRAADGRVAVARAVGESALGMAVSRRRGHG